MKVLEYKKNELVIGTKKITELATRYPTPFYLYAEKEILDNYDSFYQAALEQKIERPLVCFALKANPNPSLLLSLFKAGAGADIVSVGELRRALENGCDPQKIVFSGVGKTQMEIEGALDCHPKGIYSFNVESIEELQMINDCAAKLKKTARVCFRLNPQVHAKTHKHISTGFKTHKFGILKNDVLKIFKKKIQFPNVHIVGLSVHIGSQLTCLKATKKAVKEVCQLMNETKHQFEFIDVGGGLGVDYHKDGEFRSADEYMQDIQKTLAKNIDERNQNIRVVFEPGRFIAASAGLFITKVVRTKKSEDCFFAVVDGGMNDFVRTSLYEAYHEIKPVCKSKSKKVKTEIVGPICETSDSFATQYKIQKLKTDDLLVVMDTGAYGHSMSSTYNLRSRPKEVVILSDGSEKLFEY